VQATKKAVDTSICNLRAVVYPICLVTLYSLVWSIFAFALANQACQFEHMTPKGSSVFYFFTNSVINVWWVIPVIVVYWPVGKCCKDKSKGERERTRSRTSSASGTGGMDHLLNEADEVFSSDDDNKSDFD